MSESTRHGRLLSRRNLVAIMLAGSALLTTSCSQPDAADAASAASDTKPVVVAGSDPVAYFAARIADGRIDVRRNQPASADLVLATDTTGTAWLDMHRARAEVLAIRETLSELLPDAAADFHRSSTALLSELDQLDRDLTAAAASIGRQPLLVTSDVYDDAAARYGLSIHRIAWEPDSASGDADVRRAVAESGARCMLWSRTPSAETTAALAAAGVRSLVIDPGVERSSRGDWMEIMRRNVLELASAAARPRPSVRAAS